jgi:sirohydrochlorin ferrochelatase
MQSHKPETTGLIIAGHGSRYPGAMDSFHAFVKTIAKECPGIQVTGANLELVPPSMEESALKLIQQGIAHIRIYPFFLLPGRHTEKDIPERTQKLQDQYPDVIFDILPSLGQNTSLIELLAREVKE